MLNVADNLKRALAAVPAELREGDNKAATAFLEGVEVTERGLEQTLAKFGVKSLDPKGEKFNPDFHQAMFEVETADVPPGSVAQVMQIGYTIGDRVLRPAMVAVAKAPAAKDAN
jgi:molecular chaperone GrpE